MRLKYVGKNIQLRDNFKEVVTEKFDRLDKYFHEDVEAVVTMGTEGNRKRVEVTIRIPGSHTILRAEESSLDMLQSVDQAVSALMSQVRKYKTKLKKRHHGNESIRFEQVEQESLGTEENTPEVVRVKRISLRPMSTEEAILQMDLLGHDFFAYLDAETEKMSVVYRRKAGQYGQIIQE